MPSHIGEGWENTSTGALAMIIVQDTAGYVKLSDSGNNTFPYPPTPNYVRRQTPQENAIDAILLRLAGALIP